jgi:murein tripeptide amidase MpaA
LIILIVIGPAIPALAGAADRAILPPELPWSGESRSLIAAADDPWITPSEATGLSETPGYDATVDWLRKLVAAAPQLELVSIGKSAEGREIWMVVASAEGASTPAALHGNGRPTLLAHAGIHSGEIDGKDAGLMLLRDMTVGGRKTDLLDGANVLFIPILSVDAHERFSRFSRINQRGPLEIGWRTNGRNLNLNRDFTKLETEELRALVRAVNAWKPDLYLDLHVTDGTDYQYDVTYGFNGPHAWSPAIARWLEGTLTPAIERDLKAMGHLPGPFVYAINGRDMTEGLLVWTAKPRFSNGWGDARHLPTLLVETHSLKPYDQRVLGTYVLLESAARVLAANHAALSAAMEIDRASRPERVTLAWKNNSAAEVKSEPFKAVRSESYESEVSGAITVRWTGDAVEEKVVRVRMDQPETTARSPRYYYIPAAWYPIAEMLERQGIEIERLADGVSLAAEVYRLPDAAPDVENSPYEGRTRYVPGKLEVQRREVRLPADSFRVTTNQPLGTLAVLMLEPESPDSMFQWGYFAEILQRAEYFEAYVIEPMAQAMLQEDPTLRAAFEQRLTQDAAFAADPDARLRWFYNKTPFFDSRYRVYPVVRSVD